MSGKDITEGDVTAFDADKFLEDVKYGANLLCLLSLLRANCSACHDSMQHESFPGVVLHSIRC